MDNILLSIQNFIFKMDDMIPFEIRLYKLGNKMQDIRSNHTMK